MRATFLIAALIFMVVESRAQELVPYKQMDTTVLSLEVHRPPSMEVGISYPAVVFFFGGGWRGGDRYHFLRQAQYFAKRGLVCFLADYRTFSKHGTSPIQSLEDAKSAMRFIRKHADRFQVDPQKIIASGGSAGGHLAAATAFINDFNASDDDLGISPMPSALVLFNPVIDNGPGGYGYERVGENYRDFSPLHNLMPGAPPTLFMLGTEDALIPVQTAEYYKVVMERVGGRCDLLLYEGAGHGFFNYGRAGDFYGATLQAADNFLQSLGYLDAPPEVKD